MEFEYERVDADWLKSEDWREGNATQHWDGFGVEEGREEREMHMLRSALSGGEERKRWNSRFML